jgi:hypothetical protein
MIITIRIGGAFSPETVRRYLRHVADCLHEGNVSTGNAALEDEFATGLYDAKLTPEANGVSPAKAP